MLAPEKLGHESVNEKVPVPQGVLPAELEFYESYAWCLNPHLTVREAIDRLRAEIDRLAIVPRGWQTGEVAANIFLLSCGLLNCVDEYLRGPGLRLPSRLAAMRLARGARWVTENVFGNLQPRSRAYVRRWRERWIDELNDFLSAMVAEQASEPASFAGSGKRLAALLRSPLPSDLQARTHRYPVSVPPPRPDACRRPGSRKMLCEALPRSLAGDPARGAAHIGFLFCPAIASTVRGRRVRTGVVPHLGAGQRPGTLGGQGAQTIRQTRIHRPDRG